MTSIHPKAHLCFVAPDGDGGFVLKMKARNDATLVEFDLTPRTAAVLVRDLAGVLIGAYGAQDQREAPHPTSPRQVRGEEKGAALA